MSILIKGMKMPKNCDECRIMTYEDTNCISVHELFCGCPIVFRAHPQHEEHRPDYCPLVSIPPHGRLIDADALKDKDFRYEIHGIPTARMIFARTIELAPTIIEAEEDDDE